jgi:Transposase IS66 family/IS66 C-terminal element
MVSVPGSTCFPSFVSAEALPPRWGPRRARALGQPVCPSPAICKWSRTGSLRFPGGPSHTSARFADPGRIGGTSPLAVSSMLPPVPTRRRLQRDMISGLNPGLWYPLPTLHERRHRHPCKARFRLAGCAFTGRVSNPLDRDERFQVTSVLLSRTCPDASWAHARRKIYDVFVATKSPIAEEAVKRIAELYAIESGVRGEPAEERQRVRHEKSRPLVEAMHVWLNEQLGRIPGASTLAKAIRYALNHWNGLVMFLEDGRLELDTNTVERAIRPVTITKKNSLFAGNDNGGRHWAIIATLVQSAKLNGVEPLAWLTDVLERMVSGRTKRHELETLLPWNWKAAKEAEAAGTG